MRSSWAKRGSPRLTRRLVAILKIQVIAIMLLMGAGSCLASPRNRGLTPVTSDATATALGSGEGSPRPTTAPRSGPGSPGPATGPTTGQGSPVPATGPPTGEGSPTDQGSPMPTID